MCLPARWKSRPLFEFFCSTRYGLLRIDANTHYRRNYRILLLDAVPIGIAASCRTSRTTSPTERQAHASDATPSSGPAKGPSREVRANRRDIRFDIFVEAARLMFLKLPDKTSFGLCPHSDTTLRNKRLRNATTLRLLKDGTRTPPSGPPRADGPGEGLKVGNSDATKKAPSPDHDLHRLCVPRTKRE